MINKTVALKGFLAYIQKNILPKSLLFHKGDKSSKQVALTFDDGPYPGNTEKILRILGKHKIKATFFMTGKGLERDKDSVIEVFNEGHEIGNHFYRHKPVTELTFLDLKREIEGFWEILNKIYPENTFPKIIRPPYGKLDLKTLWYAWENGYSIILWSLDTKDLEDMPLEENIKILESERLKGGDIILLHDDSKRVEGLLEWLIRWVKSQGLGFAKLSELIKRNLD